MPVALRFSLVLIATTACAMSPVSPGDRLPAGIWGGDRIQLSVASDGGATDFDCAHGTIEQPIVVDRGGRFAATGHHVFEHGGPVRDDEPPNRHPARYRGQITGDTMTLTITLTDTAQEVGTF